VAEQTTRDRLISAALRLFAAQGYQRTTVGEIEAAAGFTARGGTLYKHFDSKEALLAAAIDQQAADVGQTRGIADLLPLGDLRAETILVFRYLFTEISRYRDITALIEKEGDGAPHLAQRFWDQIAEPGYRLGAQVLGRQLADHGQSDWDADALAVILIGAVVNVRRAQWTFGQLPLGVPDERIVQAITRIIETLAAPASERI
jgi:AcrR family transcriptional regulator